MNTDELRIFFSYSTKDKTIIARLKDSLERYGFEVFVAHDEGAIEPAVEWQNDIIDNIKKCDIFIPFITKNFKESEWADQETGMAIINEKFILPLGVDLYPYGFIGKIQSLKVNKKKLTSKISREFETYIKDELPAEIFKVLVNVPKFEGRIFDMFIKNLRIVESFERANNLVKLIEQFNSLTPKQVKQIYRITKENRQIREAYIAKRILYNFFKKYREHSENDE